MQEASFGSWRRRATATLAVAVMMVGALAQSATADETTTVPLQPDHQGTASDCGSGVNWHFVLVNLDPGTPAGTLTAQFSGAGEITVVADKVVAGGRTQHFNVVTPTDDTLLDASAVVVAQSKQPGEPSGPRLVLSDFSCVEQPPPPDDGTIIIEKYALPPGEQPFEFTGDLGDFVIVDREKGTGNPGSQATFSGLAAGSYTIIELVPEGWELRQIACEVLVGDGSTFTVDLGSHSVTIQLAEGETVYCDFQNRQPR